MFMGEALGRWWVLWGLDTDSVVYYEKRNFCGSCWLY